MRKILYCFLGLWVLMFSSCQSIPNSNEVFTLPMRFTAKTNGSNAFFTVDITSNDCTIEFCENNALHGTKLYFCEEKNKLTIGSFTREIKNGTFPAFESLIKAIKLLATTESIGIYEENGIKYTIDEIVILVYYDKDNKTVMGIRTEELGRVFEFTLSDLEPYEAQSNSAS